MTEKVIEKRRLASPATTPQALAWDSRNKTLWMGSRDLRRIYAIDPENGTVLKQQEAPGIPWAAVVLNGELRFTIGEGAEDDRYIYRYTPEAGFSKMFACPEFTGSYLSFDGKNLYMSQWYKKRVLMFDDQGNVIREIDVGAEICGHTFANGSLYVLRGQEQPNEDWRIARLNPQEETPVAEDIAVVPFACSLTDFRRRTVLVQLSRERHDHFVRPAELEGFSTVRSTGYRLLRRLLRRRTSRASVEEDFPRAIRLSYPCGSKGADLRSCFIENGTAGESQVASGVCYDALGLPAERCDCWFEEF